MRGRSFLLSALAVVALAGTARAQTAAEKNGMEYGIAAPLVSTCPVNDDVPAPVRSTATITAEPPPPLDVVQRKISDAFVTPIAWFDSLFFTDRDEVETNDSYLRAIIGPVWTNGQGVKVRHALRVKIRVPRLQERLHLIFSSDDEGDLESAPGPRNNGPLDRSVPFNVSRGANNRLVTDNTTQNRSRAGLGYEILKLINTDLDVETAFQSHFHAELSVRARHDLPRWWNTKTKLIATGFWLQGTGFGSTGRIDNEKPLSDNALLHFDNAVTQVEDINGVVEESRLSLEMRLSARTGLNPNLGIRGETSPRWRATAYYTSVVLRRQFFRDWLFYEIEPGENWNRDEFGAFPPQPFIAFRIEAQFRKSEK